MSILDLFGCRHRERKLVKIIHYEDVSYIGPYRVPPRPGTLQNGVPSTKTIWRCNRCGELFKRVHCGFGYLTEKDINGN